MLLLRAYFDESGHAKDPNLHFTGMAGFVAPTQVWDKVAERWNAVTVSPQMVCDSPFICGSLSTKVWGNSKGGSRREKTPYTDR
jgi:hypothetical protein